MGLVTTAAAGAAGISPMALVMMERRGVLERASHGVYRLARFPVHPLVQLRLGTLWPYPVEGVLSHESALELHELSDIMPAVVHVTVPRRYRMRRAVPAWLRLHRGEFAPDELTHVEGIPVSTVERSIRDGIAIHLGSAIIGDAIEDARGRGTIDAHTADVLTAELRGDGARR